MGHVLKANRVRLEKPVRLSIDGAGTVEDTGVRPPEAHPRVRLAENGPEFAVLEVTCSCGQVIHVRCEYAATDGTPANRKPGEP